MQKPLLAFILGVLSFVVFMVSAEAIGEDSEISVLTGCATGGLFLAVGQFVLVLKKDEAEVEDETVIPMLAPVVAVFLLIAALEKWATVMAQGVPLLLAGCLGTLAGAAAGRRTRVLSSSACSRDACLKALRTGAALLLAVAATLAFVPHEKARAAVIGGIVVAVIHLALALLMLWKPRAPAIPVLSGAVSVTLGLLLFAIASSYMTHNADMHGAAVALYFCSAADLLAGISGLIAALAGAPARSAARP